MIAPAYASALRHRDPTPLRVMRLPVRSGPAAPAPARALGWPGDGSWDPAAGETSHAALDGPDRAGPVQEHLDLDLVGSSPSTRLRLVPPTTEADDFGPRPTPTSELPDGPQFAARIGLSLLQVAVGARPAAQVTRYVTPEVYEGLLHRHTQARRRRLATRRPMRVRRVLSTVPRDGALEASVVLDDAHRVRAVALRLDGLDGRWVVTELLIG